MSLQKTVCEMPVLASAIVDKKNIYAMSMGPEWMLGAVTNLRAETEVRKFREKYGELRRGFDDSEYLDAARLFRAAWDATTPKEKQEMSEVLSNVFNPTPTVPTRSRMEQWVYVRPAVVADLTSGRLTIQPRDLFDWLAQVLIQSRNRLAHCDRKGCETPYFVKHHGKQKYCSQRCGNPSRAEGKAKWWKKHKAEINRRRRMKRGRRAHTNVRR